MTTQPKWTPGPWKYSFESPAVDSVWAIVTDRAGGIVANVNPETGPDATSAPATRKMPAEANAKLIAAAPMLAEVLIGIADYAHKLRGDLPLYSQAERYLANVEAQARAALKAAGCES